MTQSRTCQAGGTFGRQGSLRKMVLQRSELKSKRLQDQVPHRCLPDLARRLRSTADQYGTIQRVPNPEAVAAFDEPGVKRHHVEERPEAQLLLQQPADGSPFRPGELGVEE